MKTHIIIQARLGSKRLPEKVLKPIGRYNSLELIHKRVSKCKMVDGIFFAIPSSKDNIKLKNFISNKINGHNFFYQKIKNRVSSRLLAKIRVSQVFWEPIKNRVSPRSALLEAVYLEALLYLKCVYI